MKKIKPLELSSKENQVHKVLSKSRQMQRTQQNLREASKPHRLFKKIKNFQTDKRQILQGVFEAYLKSRIDALGIQDTSAYDTLKVESKSTMDYGRCSVC